MMPPALNEVEDTIVDIEDGKEKFLLYRFRVPCCIMTYFADWITRLGFYESVYLISCFLCDVIKN